MSNYQSSFHVIVLKLDTEPSLVYRSVHRSGLEPGAAR